MRRFILAIRERALVEEWGQTNAFLSELTNVKGVSGSIARTALRSQSSVGVVDLGPAGDDTAGSEIRRSPGTRPMRFPHRLQQAPRWAFDA